LKIQCRKNLGKNFAIFLLLFLIVTVQFKLLSVSTPVDSFGENSLFETLFTEDTQNDAGSGGDAGDTFENATDISFGTYLGELPAGDINDFYKFYINDELPISIGVAGTVTSDLNLYIYNAEQILLSSHTSASAVEEHNAVFQPGWYVIQIVTVTGNSTYYLTITVLGMSIPTEPTTPPDDWLYTPPNTDWINNLLNWIVPSILVIAIIIAIVVFVRTRNRTVYTQSDRKNKARRIQKMELQDQDEVKVIDPDQRYTFDLEKDEQK